MPCLPAQAMSRSGMVLICRTPCRSTLGERRMSIARRGKRANTISFPTARTASPAGRAKAPTSRSSKGHRMLYEVRALQGNVVTSVRVEALNESDARSQVTARALQPLSVRTAGHGLGRLGGARSSGLSLLLLSQELLALLEGGLTIVESIDVLAEKESRPAVRTLYARIARGLTEGKSFSACIE